MVADFGSTAMTKPCNVRALLDVAVPVVVIVGFERGAMVGEDVVQVAAPAVAAIVGVQAVADGLICGALHRDVQRGVDAQAAFVNGFGAVGAFEIFANFLDEIGREIVARHFDVQTERLRRRPAWLAPR